MGYSSTLPEIRGEDIRESQAQFARGGLFRRRLRSTIYALALAVSISTWFVAIRAPLWQDEAGSYWQIDAGFSQIWPRQFSTNLFPAYSYILWLSTKLIGTSEIALRIPSILAMLGAASLLFLSAREIFERDLAIVATVIFCLDPIVIFASIDVRPYAFAVLVTIAAIYVLLRLRRSDSNWLAALFGLLAGCVIWFHYLFGAILPGLFLCFIAIKFPERNKAWKQLSVGLGSFALAFLPVIPGLLYLFHTSGTHVCENAPNLVEVAWTVAPGWLLPAYGLTALAAAAGVRSDRQIHFRGWHVLVCVSLAFTPILILYGVSVGTSIHTFASRYRLDAIPGIALCWALALSRLRSRRLQLLFCVALAATTALQCFTSPRSRFHETSIKYALELAGKEASVDDAPVLICSDFVESDYVTMPSPEATKDSFLFAPLSYYPLRVPVVALPQQINNETIQIGSRFLREAAQKHERFLVVADRYYSYKTLDWFADNAAMTHSVRELGVLDGVEILEFVPRADPAGR